MKKFLSVGLWLILMLQAAFALDPQGEWLDADGLARIKIVDCDGRMWGATVWEKTPGVDDHNPNPAKRSRPTLGIPILRDMKPAQGTPDRWDGEVYNPEDGKTYTAYIRPLTANTLELKGCVLKYICLGQTWTRYVEPAPAPGAAPKAAPAKQPAAPAPVAPKAGTKAAAGAAPVNPNAEFCAAVIQAAK